MLMMLTVILALGTLSIFLLKLSNDYTYSITGDVMAFTGILGCVITTIALLVYLMLGWYWIASEYKADIINREYQTNYTQAEIFYASDVIDTIRQLDRKRYEVNGNIMQKH